MKSIPIACVEDVSGAIIDHCGARITDEVFKVKFIGSMVKGHRKTISVTLKDDFTLSEAEAFVNKVRNYDSFEDFRKDHIDYFG